MNEILHNNPELEAYGLANKHEAARKAEEESSKERVTKYRLYEANNTVREKSHYASDVVREKAQSTNKKQKEVI